MLFTIAICTYNRAQVIHKALDSAIEQTLPGSNFEILVVDNNSTDDTRDVVRSYKSMHAGLRLVSEPRQGLSIARNRAWKEAGGDLIVYVDDDAALATDYLERLEEVAAEESMLGAAGGPINVGWMGAMPGWWEPGLEIWYNHLDLGRHRKKLQYPEIFYGTNMAFPVSVLKEAGGFSPELGRTGRGLLDSEEAEIFIRVEKAGYDLVYDPGLEAVHYITEERLSREYLLEKARQHGKSQCIAERMHPDRGGAASMLGALAASYARILARRSRGRLSEKLIQTSARAYLAKRLETL